MVAEHNVINSEAGRNEFPWAVRLEIRIGEKNFHCGGSLVSDRSVQQTNFQQKIKIFIPDTF